MPEKERINQIIKLMFEASRSLRDEFRHSCKPKQMSWVNFHTLRFIHESENPTMKEVAEHLNITPPSATSLVDNYINDGQLVRILDNHDRRIVRLELSAKGKRQLKAGLRHMSEIMETKFSGLSDQELDELRNIFEKMLKKNKG